VLATSSHPLVSGIVALVLGGAILAGGYNLSSLSRQTQIEAERHPPVTMREKFKVRKARSLGESSGLAKVIGVVVLVFGIAATIYGMI
jgi:hypothetical protein